MNDFSMLTRLFGNLFYRAPQDPVLAGVLDWLNTGQLTALWALSLDAQSEQALKRLTHIDKTAMQSAYQQLFAENGSVSCKISDYSDTLDDFIQFRRERGLPDIAEPDHIAHLLLSASWLEDNVDSLEAQRQLFSQFLLPILKPFLGKVEAHDQGYYQALAQLCRDSLSAMADELDEESESAV
ncbi:TorD/DmsD family molecular chaperone [Spirabiliibacterium falconis]|uniref:TorD/DmsD family molecular chaperone n=1 Tax=Spirabiliibacterium falconis TaxID=572023 RepID=UPI001AAC857F|nr:molecular chaperone [Spirabiliibacterium falconis]MBE2893822.1 molecular chaperone [Spirabiliibacterium falconis]